MTSYRPSEEHRESWKQEQSRDPWDKPLDLTMSADRMMLTTGNTELIYSSTRNCDHYKKVVWGGKEPVDSAYSAVFSEHG